MGDIEKFIAEKSAFAPDFGWMSETPVVSVSDLREFCKGKVLANSEEFEDMREDAARYRWLRKRAGQIGAFLWRRAPWIHENYTENQARLDLCIDEERVDEIDREQALQPDPEVKP